MLFPHKKRLPLGPIPPVRGKCHEVTKGVGKVPPQGADEGNARVFGNLGQEECSLNASLV